MTVIHIEQGDITTCRVDAIVNPANNDLQLGGGVAGAISRSAGPTVQAECDKHGRIAVGEAVITGAGKLPAKFVIHQASMRLGSSTTADNLGKSTRAVLQLADAKGLTTLAFPGTGTGIGGFPLQTCAQIMLREVAAHIAAGTGITDIYFVLKDADACEMFRKVYAECAGK